MIEADTRATPGCPGARVDRRPLLRLGLWTLVGCASVFVFLSPEAYMAMWWPPIATAVCAVAATVGLTLFQLGALHFRAVGRPLELLVGIGFGVLGIANLVCGALSATSALPLSRLHVGTLLMFLAHTLADSIFAVAVLQAHRVVSLGLRASVMVGVSASVALALIVLTAILFWEDGSLPDELSAHVLVSLNGGKAEPQIVGDESIWLVAVNILLTLLLITVSYRLMLLARDMRDGYLEILSVGMILLAFSQAHTVLFPLGVPGYVSTGDGLRLLAYVALLMGLTSQTTRSLVVSASNLERMRLSRELHDGLAQYLSTLKFRLTQALESDSALSEQLLRNLQISYRLAQDALLEARHAITSLRSGTIGWEDFIDAVEVFCAEAADNHDISIKVTTRGHGPRVHASLQLEVLRILNETISNAVRHGEAKQTDVDLEITPSPLQLVLHVRDNGRGFTGGQHIGAGVGMRSLNERLAARGGRLALESSPTGGTTIRADLPLADRAWFS